MVRISPELNASLAKATLDTVTSGHFDAIVIGAGASGGLAAALLCEAGLKVLTLDAGWETPFWQAPLRRTMANTLAALANPKTARTLPPGLVWKGQRLMQKLGALRQPVQTRCYAWPSLPEGFVDDRANPYEAPDDAPFEWIRVHGLGGRMVVPLHGRQYLRHGAKDFRHDDGLSPPWPFPVEELVPWYEKVEERLGLFGGAEHNFWIPDSKIAHPLAPSTDESILIDKVGGHYPGYRPMLGRFAPPVDWLSAAARTGKFTCRTGAKARHVITDENGRAAGVVFYDKRSGNFETAKAPLVFACASTLETTRILLSTRAERGAERNDEDDALGKYLMDHATIKAEGMGPSLYSPGEDVVGRCVYLPRYDRRSIHGLTEGFGRGFGVRVYQSPAADGRSYFTAVCDAEMLPRPDNRVTLSDNKDSFGIPTLNIYCTHSEYERTMATYQARALRELAEYCGAQITTDIDQLAPPGSTIHECGSARMGEDPKTSVLNPQNEMWETPGLFVTDGASFPSQGIQNPTLTIMALTARACAKATA